MNTMAAIDRSRLERAAATVGRELGAELVVLFGSAARGDALSGSDLDLGVLAPGGIDAVAVTNRFIELLRVQHVDVSDLRRADALLLALAARDGLPLYEREAGAFARFQSLAARRFADTRKFRQAEGARQRA